MTVEQKLEQALSDLENDHGSEAYDLITDALDIIKNSRLAWVGDRASPTARWYRHVPTVRPVENP